MQRTCNGMDENGKNNFYTDKYFFINVLVFVKCETRGKHKVLLLK